MSRSWKRENLRKFFSRGGKLETYVFSLYESKCFWISVKACHGIHSDPLYQSGRNGLRSNVFRQEAVGVKSWPSIRRWFLSKALVVHSERTGTYAFSKLNCLGFFHDPCEFFASVSRIVSKAALQPRRNVRILTNFNFNRIRFSAIPEIHLNWTFEAGLERIVAVERLDVG